jgi:hypothetical protein
MGELDDVAGSALRPASAQGRGGSGTVLRDAAHATPQEVAASAGGATAGQPTSSTAGREMRAGLLESEGPIYECWRCGHTTENPSNVHLGHRNVPRSHGGNLSETNVCIEGAACNLGAGNRGGPNAGRSCAERGGCGTPYGRTD